ncbi:sugar ABC transporter ATP-binding protein [uncultured Sphaerochaeta sp.]|uniref:sugar ABC transporter ATP-binding protein n=1 Tax=uncultured Sphaerochaeta sp. TaxID=886478 RepID=UPI0029CA8EBC|nr:sugar ABC transporter ATP-binding protein [uncultured Sphaerochaeta sp.]
MDEPKILLSLEGIVKEFSSVRVLDRVSFSIREGEVMGLIGENGAGKSTLMKILSGIYQKTEGTIRLDGQLTNIPDYITAKKLGIGIVPQEFNLINYLTVFENIFLGNEIHKGLLLDKAKMREEARAQLELLKMPLDVNKYISELSVAEKQMVEIAKAMILDTRVLIFDEPTTTLTPVEVKTLFSLMRKLKEKKVTMLFVSHKLQEVMTICDRVTVLRDGKLVSVDEVKHVDADTLARKMVGRDFSQVFPPKKDRRAEELVLEVKNLKSDPMVKDVSFSLHRGEILGFAGLVGSGRTETMEAVMGLRRMESGEIHIKGKPAKIRSAKDAVSLGLGYISEDRQGKGIVMNYDITKNISLISLKDKYLKGLLIDKKAETAASDHYIDEFNIVAASKKSELRFFSGGNQQKVYLARWMDTDPEILILDEPTRGIDINAKREIYEFIHQLSEAKISCIIISSEMEEIIGMCNRAYVMREGKIASCLDEEEITEENIVFNATGIKKGVEKDG